MNRFVFDTHALIYALEEPAKLGLRAKQVRLLIETGRAEAFVPAAAVAEILLLGGLGRTKVTLTPIAAACEQGMSFLPLDLAQLSEFAACTLLRDPFDRLIVSAARAMGAKLITKDGLIEESGLVQTVWS